MTKRLIAATLGLALILGFSGCAANRHPFAAGSTYSSFAKELNPILKKYADTALKLEESPGSRGNIRRVDFEKADLGIAQSDALYASKEGLYNFKSEGKVDGIRALGALYTEQAHLIVRKEAIRKLSDLKGKTVAIGNIEGGAYYTAMALTEALGLEAGTDIWFHTEEMEDGLKALQKGEVAAAIIVGGAPCVILESLLKDSALELFPIDGKVAEQMIATGRGYSAETIAAGTYEGQQKAVATIGVKAVLICNADLPAERAKAITAAIFDHAQEIDSPLAKEIRIETAREDIFIPLHQGAAEYFAAK